MLCLRLGLPLTVCYFDVHLFILSLPVWSKPSVVWLHVYCGAHY